MIYGKKIVPIEIKNKTEVTKDDLKNMKFFLKKFNTKEGFIIYNGEDGAIKVGESRIALIPLWKWLLSNKFNDIYRGKL